MYILFVVIGATVHKLCNHFTSDLLINDISFYNFVVMYLLFVYMRNCGITEAVMLIK